MEKQFKKLEQEFSQLKKKFWRGRMSRQEFIEELRKLPLKDRQGRFWMIGAKSGKWYYYDGKNWIQSKPPSLKEGKAICIYCGYENNLEDEVCAGCGQNLADKQALSPISNQKLAEPSGDFPFYGKKERSLKNKQNELEIDKEESYFIFRSLNPLSIFFFMGTAGVFMGILGGVLLGATDILGQIAVAWPLFLGELQGTLIGGIVYAFLGGIIGFVGLGVSGGILALFINFISSFVGGVKIRLD